MPEARLQRTRDVYESPEQQREREIFEMLAEMRDEVAKAQQMMARLNGQEPQPVDLPKVH